MVKMVILDSAENKCQFKVLKTANINIKKITGQFHILVC